MAEHPSGFELEAVHAGENIIGVRQHAEVCDPCGRYLDWLESRRSELLSNSDPNTFVTMLRFEASKPQRRVARWRQKAIWLVAASVLLTASVVFLTWYR